MPIVLSDRIILDWIGLDWPWIWTWTYWAWTRIGPTANRIRIGTSMSMGLPNSCLDVWPAGCRHPPPGLPRGGCPRPLACARTTSWTQKYLGNKTQYTHR